MKMYGINYNDTWEVFDSLEEAERFVERAYNLGIVDEPEQLEIVPYHWTMG